MANFARLRATATRLVRKNGRDVVLRRDSRQAKNDDKPWRGNRPCPAEEITVKAAIVSYREKDIDGERIKRGDRQAVIEVPVKNSEDVDARFYDLIEDRDEKWRIVTMDKVEPANLTVVYIAQLRA